MHDNITIFRLEGNSMRPYLVGGRDKAIVESPAENAGRVTWWWQGYVRAKP